MAKQAQQVFFAGHRAEDTPLPKGPSSLEPSTQLQDRNKQNKPTQWLSALELIPALSYPKQLTVFFRAQANIMP